MTLKSQSILINGRFFSQPLTGVQRFAKELLSALDKELSEAENAHLKISIICPKNAQVDVHYKNITVQKKGVFTGYFWEQVELPLFAQKNLLINLCNLGPLIKKNQMVFIHDAGPVRHPQAYGKFFRTFYKIAFKIFSLRSKQLATVSDFSRQELISFFPAMKNKMEVIYNASEHFEAIKPDESILTKNDLLPRQYIFSLGSMQQLKNVPALTQAIANLHDKDPENCPTLVITGRKNSRIFSDLAFERKKFIKEVGILDDRQLKALFENASCFVFPSLYEGFGIPPIEAMQCSCPVIVSNAASLPEVCGEAALYCDPSNIEDIADKIKQLTGDDALRKELIAKGLTRSQRFSWQLSAKKLIHTLPTG